MVKPKQKRVEEAKEALQLAQQSLAQKQASLKKVLQLLSNLKQILINILFQKSILEAVFFSTRLKSEMCCV